MSKLSTLSRYYHTIRYLKGIQIRYRIWYWLKNRLEKTPFSKRKVALPRFFNARPLILIDSIPTQNLYGPPRKFRFLNIEHQFDQAIDWNFSGHGKLWTYNLNYFEFLTQEDLPASTGLHLIRDFIAQGNRIKDGMEPFPISLRTLFWIRFLTKHQIQDEKIHDSLYRQLIHLSRRLEYHLMGNHLLENGFALLFGACYFSDASLFKKAEKILSEQLKEQILSDGAHFELSPMYHQLVLYRLLDGVNFLSQHAIFKSGELLFFLRQQAQLMLGWLREIAFSNSDLPRVNDSTVGIAPELNALLAYAERLDLHPEKVILRECGYRKYLTDRFELLIDAGSIGPDYIPGHAHSDTFNFVLYHRSHPLIVDTGISTYEKNARRMVERATAAHNTVMVAGREQSDVWGGFRVARRAKVTILEISGNYLKAAHDGYRRMGVQHERSFTWTNDHIEIRDLISGDQPAKAFLHFHPDVKVRLQEQAISGAFGKIYFHAPSRVSLQSYDYALAFNRTIPAQLVVIEFKQQLLTKIQLL